MSFGPSHDQSRPDVVEVQARSALVEQVVAIGFLATVSVAMVGWLYVLAIATAHSISWLFP